jgi:hypothetical protein
MIITKDNTAFECTIEKKNFNSLLLKDILVEQCQSLHINITKMLYRIHSNRLLL